MGAEGACIESGARILSDEDPKTIRGNGDIPRFATASPRLRGIDDALYFRPSVSRLPSRWPSCDSIAPVSYDVEHLCVHRRKPHGLRPFSVEEAEAHRLRWIRR